MKSLRILLVDDDAFIGILLAEMLGEMGYVICGIEATEPGAVEAALRHKPDLMIVDERLGSGSGVGAVETISRSTVIPHIFMSGDLLPATPSAIVLQKPFMRRDLIAAIARATYVAGAWPA